MDRDSITRMIMVMVLGVVVILAWNHFRASRETRPEPREEHLQ